MAIEINIYVGSNNKTHTHSDKDHSLIQSLSRAYLNDFTLIKSKGVWEDSSEDSIIIQKIIDKEDLNTYNDKITGLVHELKQVLNQSSILITTKEICCIFA